MNFIFSKKALWAVVFAVAAIFATTFVACDNGSTTNTDWLHEYEPDDLVYWVNLDDATKNVWVVVPLLDALPTGAIEGDAGNWVVGGKIKKNGYFLGVDGTSPAPIGTTNAPTGLAEGSISEVLAIAANGTQSTMYLVANADGKLVAPVDLSAKKLKLVETIPASSFFPGVDASGSATAIAGAGAPTTLVENSLSAVQIIDTATGLLAGVLWCKGNGDGKLVQPATDYSNAKYKLKVVGTLAPTSLFEGKNAAAIDTTNAPTGLAENSISEVLVIDTATGVGAPAYFLANSDGQLLAVGDLSNAKYKINLVTTFPATAFFGGVNASSAATAIAGAGAPTGLTEGSLSEVFLINTTLGTAVGTMYYAANADGKLVQPATDYSDDKYKMHLVTSDKYSKDKYITVVSP